MGQKFTVQFTDWINQTTGAVETLKVEDEVPDELNWSEPEEAYIRGYMEGVKSLASFLYPDKYDKTVDESGQMPESEIV